MPPRPCATAYRPWGAGPPEEMKQREDRLAAIRAVKACLEGDQRVKDDGWGRKTEAEADE